MKLSTRLVQWFNILAVFSVATSSLIAAFPTTQIAHADGTAAAPVITIQYGDDSGDITPELPGDCEKQKGSIGTTTYDDSRPDCLRVQINDPPSITYTSDFRFCLVYSGHSACTAWASDIGLGESRVYPPVSGGSAGSLSGTMEARVETRDLPSTLPVGTTFGNVAAGVALFYQDHDAPCSLASSGMQWAGQGGALSAWAFGANRDNDPGCFSAGLRIGAVNAPPDAEFVSSSIPGTLAASTDYNNKYNIVMKNKGLPWPIDYGQGNSTIRPTDGHCDAANFDYDVDGHNVCSDYSIFSSQRFRLARIDTTPISIRAKELRPNSNDVTYNGHTYTYSGEDKNIDYVSNPSDITTANTIPFFVKQVYSYHRVTGEEYICVPGGPTGGPIHPPTLSSKPSLTDKVMAFLSIKQAQARAVDPDGEVCDFVQYDYIDKTAIPAQIDVNAGDQAIFAPVNLTTPAPYGTYTLKFRMVDLQNLETNANGWQYGKFGDIAPITIKIGDAPLFNLICGVYQSVPKGTNANYDLSATTPSGYSKDINVTMAGSPTGPAMLNSPVVLSLANSPLPYRRTAVVPTTNLTPGTTYTLTFTGTDGTSTGTCQSQLTIIAIVATADLKFDNSDGPTTPTPSTGSTGKLSWTTKDAVSCTGSMTQGGDTTNPNWSGARLEGNSTERTFDVTGLQVGNTYVFKIICLSASNEEGPPDTVEVRVGNPQNPTANLKCMGTDGVTNDSSCTVASGSSALLLWDTTFTTSCSIVPGFGNVALNEPDGQSTSALTTGTTFTLTCQGNSGTPNATDSVNIAIAVQDPPPPPVISANNNLCGKIVIKWTISSSPPPPTNFRVFKSNGLGHPDPERGAWTDISGSLAPNVFTFTDVTPLASNNYYLVRAYNGDDLHSNSNVVLQNSIACAPTLASSDKDISHVTGQITKNFTPVPCSGVSEIASLGNALYTVNDVVTFKINVCNSGTAALTGVTIADTLLNLSEPGTATSPQGCLTGQSYDSRTRTINFSLNDVAAQPEGSDLPTVCSIIFTAKVTAPAVADAALHRFQNVARIHAAEISANNTAYPNDYYQVMTPPYLFSITGGVPDRIETAPH
jgi:hypothetical protein